MNRRLWIQVGAVTLVFAGVYAVMRSLPVEPCEVLHASQRQAGDVVQFCGPDEADFLKTAEMRFSAGAELRALGEVEVGREVAFELTLRGPMGEPLEAEAIALSHGELVHLMVIDPSLEDYHHLHPLPTGTPGVFTFSMTPERAGRYQCFAELVAMESSRLLVLPLTVDVPGDADTPKLGGRELYTADGLRCEVVGADELRPGQRGNFELKVRADDGEPVVLTPFMNSYAHVVLFDEALTGLAHAHPLGYALALEPKAGPELRFSVRLPEAGRYRLWAQVHAGGKLRAMPFDLEVGR